MNTKLVSRSMLMIAVTLLGGTIVASGIHQANATGTLGLIKQYGAGIGGSQPYEPAGPWIDGVLVASFLTNQNNEWAALKAGTIDLYDWPMRPSQIAEYNSNICVPAPNLPSNVCVDSTGSHTGFDNIKNQIATVPVNAFGKDEVDMQNALFPTNIPQYRQAVGFATDKQAFISNVLGAFGASNYGIVGCPALCNPNGFWVDPQLVEGSTACFAVAGNPLPYTAGGNCNQPTSGSPPGGVYPNVAQARADAANALLDAAGMPVCTATTGPTPCSSAYLGFRVDETATCASQTIPIIPATTVTKNDCGLPIKPVFYVRLDDPQRTALGEQLRNVLEVQLHIDMNLGAQACTFPTGAGYCNYQEVLRHAVLGPVFLNFQYNMYTGAWGLSRDPTYIDDLYDSNFIRPGNTNYPNFNSAAFNGFARGLRAATSLSAAKTSAYAAEHAFNDSLPIVDVWTATAPLAYRIFHSDSDSVLNGLKWEGIQTQVGVGPYTAWSWFNAHLVGAPLHDPSHPVFIKWGWKTDILDNPNPQDSSFVWDAFAYGLEYDSLNNLATDDPSFAGDTPWMTSLPVTTVVASGAAFPNGEVCTPDAPATACSVLSYQMRPDLSFAASLDRSIPAIPVTPADVQFTILDGRDSPTSFITSAYIHVKDVVVTGALSFDVYEKNAAIWDRHDIGGTVPISFQHWATERGFTMTDVGGVATFSPGFPDLGVNTLSSTAGAFKQGAPVGVDLGSYAFVYDSQTSFASTTGPVLFRLRQSPGLPLPAPYTANAPDDCYFTNDNVGGCSSSTGGAGTHMGGWYKFHKAGNINWYCTASTAQPCSAGVKADITPLPSPDDVINIVDLSIVAVHFNEVDGTASNPCASINGGSCPYGAAPWDISGPAGVSDGVVNIFDLTRVSVHFGQSFMGGTDAGGGTVGVTPGWISESISGT